MGLVCLFEIVIERKTNEAITDLFCDRAIAGLAPEAPSHGREVKREVMEDAQDATRLRWLMKACRCAKDGSNR